MLKELKKHQNKFNILSIFSKEELDKYNGSGINLRYLNDLLNYNFTQNNVYEILNICEFYQYINQRELIDKLQLAIYKYKIVIDNKILNNQTLYDLIYDSDCIKKGKCDCYYYGGDTIYEYNRISKAMSYRNPCRILSISCYNRLINDNCSIPIEEITNFCLTKRYLLVEYLFNIIKKIINESNNNLEIKRLSNILTTCLYAATTCGNISVVKLCREYYNTVNYIIIHNVNIMKNCIKIYNHIYNCTALGSFFADNDIYYYTATEENIFEVIKLLLLHDKHFYLNDLKDIISQNLINLFNDNMRLCIDYDTYSTC